MSYTDREVRFLYNSEKSRRRKMSEEYPDVRKFLEQPRDILSRGLKPTIIEDDPFNNRED